MKTPTSTRERSLKSLSSCWRADKRQRLCTGPEDIHGGAQGSTTCQDPRGRFRPTKAKQPDAVSGCRVPAGRVQRWVASSNISGCLAPSPPALSQPPLAGNPLSYIHQSFLVLRVWKALPQPCEANRELEHSISMQNTDWAHSSHLKDVFQLPYKV